ncbi:MAG: 16S rRNA (guanine(966)-N(2))-methyltransferase RsmD [Verrucomicrobiales bacterium]|nr:16S rRNA (guanine(966)-N(2))-methyltransferase RsmD [Verrucomicrobiales bacterium]
MTEMRIIAGTSGGIPIKVPKNATRPTTDRVRESLFSSLGTLINEANVLDLFAGSGSLGLESLSRGAKSALFVDESRAACQVIEENLKKTRLSGTVRTAKVDRFLTSISPTAQFDLIFADPPYAKDEAKSEILTRFLNHEKLPEILRKGGSIVLETCSRIPLPEMKNWITLHEKTFGETRITRLSHPEQD